MSLGDDECPKCGWEKYGGSCANCERVNLRKALAGVMPYLKCSTDGPDAILAVYISPIEQMRRQALEMESKDQAIRNARKVLKQSEGK